MANKRRPRIRRRKNRGGERLNEWRLMKMLYPKVQMGNDEDIASGIETNDTINETIDGAVDQLDKSETIDDAVDQLDESETINDAVDQLDESKTIDDPVDQLDESEIIDGAVGQLDESETIDDAVDQLDESEIIDGAVDQLDESRSLIQTDGKEDSGNLTQNVPSGRRTVDLNYFIDQIKCISNHAPELGCSIVNMKLQNEIKVGLRSELVFACNVCRMVKTVWTEPEETTTVNVDSAAVGCAISSSGGFTRTEKQMGSLNVRHSLRTFQNHSQAVSKGCESALLEMKVSAEYRMARKRGNKDCSRNAPLTVAADGSRAKQFSCTKHNSLRGMGNVSTPGASNIAGSLCRAPDIGQRNLQLSYEEYELKQGSSSSVEQNTSAVPNPFCFVFVKEEPVQEESTNSAFYEDDKSC